jgi:hypothetical protein
MALKGSNLTGADVALLSWWLSLPGIARTFAVFAAFAAIVWSARGLYSENAGLPARMTKLEEVVLDSISAVRAAQDSVARSASIDRERFEHGMMYVMCLVSNPGELACDYLVRHYPEFRMATRAPDQIR